MSVEKAERGGGGGGGGGGALFANRRGGHGLLEHAIEEIFENGAPRSFILSHSL